jgi:hypothetical protein
VEPANDAGGTDDATLTEPELPDLLDQLVRAEDSAGPLPDDRRKGGGERRCPRRLVKRSQLGARAQQFLDLGTEPNIAGAGLVQKDRPLLRKCSSIAARKIELA